MLESIKPALAITRREVRDQFRDWRIIFPVFGLTIFFPFLMNFTAAQVLNFVQRYGASLIGERLVPFLLMIVGFFPISVSLVIALESFVGEKERGSIEPLLNTPLKDWQLYVGKLLSSTVPPLASSFLGMGVYVTGLTLTGVHLPDLALMIQIVVLTVVQAVFMVSGAVVVSTQTTSVRAANLLASFIIIPVALLIQAESVVMFWGNFETLWLVVAGLFVATILLVRVGLAHFQREELLGKEIDVLNFRWGWSVFINNFIGGAHSITEWYPLLWKNTIRKLGAASLILTGLLGAAVILGYFQVNILSLPMGQKVQIGSRLNDLVQLWPVFDFAPVLMIWWQNVRTLLIALVLGIFSFGVLGVMPAMLTFGVVGYLAGLVANNGIPLWVYGVGLVLPHGILEIPAVILACAAVLKMGAVLATPEPGKTVGEILIICLAEWSKVMVGVVIPLLFVAAMAEAWVTPRLALWMFG